MITEESKSNYIQENKHAYILLYRKTSIETKTFIETNKVMNHL